jgi:hypothetical protein
MSQVNTAPPPKENGSVFKWACLLVAVVALAAFGWILNDVRLQVRDLAEKADSQLTEIKRLTEKADKQLPRILTQTEAVTGQLDRHLPRLLTQTEKASDTINTHLPTLLTHSEVAVDDLADLSDSFKQYKGLMGVVHVASQNKGMLSYGLSILSLLGGHDATIGVKKPGSKQELRRAVPAKQWASAAQKDAQFLSMVSTSKADVLHGLARTKSASPLYIQVEKQAPRLLADWLKETHPESKGVE